jgi:hypothetical protein
VSDTAPLLCWYCGRALAKGAATTNGVTLTRDHLLPTSRGGGNDPENLVNACRPCNSSKGGRTLDEFRRYLAAQLELPVGGIKFAGEDPGWRGRPADPVGGSRVRVAISVPEETLQCLRRECRRRGTNSTEVLYEALDSHLEAVLVGEERRLQELNRPLDQDALSLPLTLDRLDPPRGPSRLLQLYLHPGTCGHLQGILEQYCHPTRKLSWLITECLELRYPKRRRPRGGGRVHHDRRREAQSPGRA